MTVFVPKTFSHAIPHQHREAFKPAPAAQQIFDNRGERCHTYFSSDYASSFYLDLYHPRHYLQMVS